MHDTVKRFLIVTNQRKDPGLSVSKELIDHLEDLTDMRELTDLLI